MKKIIKSAFVAAVVAVSGYNIYQSQSVMNGMSEFALANVEALASSEKEVTCQEDPGDTCLVGSTPVEDWDEKPGWW